MLLALLLQAAAPETAVEAERAFNSMAQTKGQWTAFREFSTPDAVMFNPQPVKVQALLKDARDPKLTIQWWPAQSYVSCDGATAVNTGPWVRSGGGGYFTTVWQRQPGGRFKWVYDGGDGLDTPRALPETPQVRRASCTRPAPLDEFSPAEEGARGKGASPDGSLRWRWFVWPDGRREFATSLWTGRRWETVILDEVGAPPK